MVVFQDAIAKKAHYRKFAVRGLDGQDDFASMAEVVSRRFARLRTGVEDEYDEGFATAPNLVVIDGGKGQLSAALAAMQAYELPRVAVISLAKRVEEVFVPGRSDPIVLDPHSAGLQLLQRDQGRGAPVRARVPPPAALCAGARVALRHARGRRAGAAACAAAALRLDRGRAGREPGAARGRPGVPAKTARAIYAQLHRTGRESLLAGSPVRPGACRQIERQSAWPSVRKSALKPRTMLVTISVSFMPTLNASSVARPRPVPEKT